MLYLKFNYFIIHKKYFYTILTLNIKSLKYKILKIKVTGASGYLGKLILNQLKENGHHVSGINRKFLLGTIEDLKDEIRNSDVIINLAGAPILQRWTNKNKTIIFESRVKTTQNLVLAINNLPLQEQPKKFISASAIGIYKSGFKHNESSQNFDKGFVGNVVKNWEDASNSLSPNIQRNIFRIGLVLGKNAKTITNLLLPFKLGLGATIGNGKQAFPFIHEQDLVNAFVWAVEKSEIGGTFNLVAPENISNKDFTKALAKSLNRPAFLFIPEFILKIVLGEAAILLTEGAEVEPQNLFKAGFEFQFPDIQTTLNEIVG